MPPQSSWPGQWALSNAMHDQCIAADQYKFLYVCQCRKQQMLSFHIEVSALFVFVPAQTRDGWSASSWGPRAPTAQRTARSPSSSCADQGEKVTQARSLQRAARQPDQHRGTILRGGIGRHTYSGHAPYQGHARYVAGPASTLACKPLCKG